MHALDADQRILGCLKRRSRTSGLRRAVKHNGEYRGIPMKSSAFISRWSTSESVVKIMLTHAGGQRTMAPSHDSLLGTRERRACATGGRVPGARGTGDLGPAKAASPVLFLCRCPFTVPLESCTLNLSSITSVSSPHALTSCCPARAGWRGTR